MGNFIYSMDQLVTIQCSGEMGNVIARAEYKNDVNRYLIRYSNGNGVAVEKWWDEDALA